VVHVNIISEQYHTTSSHGGETISGSGGRPRMRIGGRVRKATMTCNACRAHFETVCDGTFHSSSPSHCYYPPPL
jgi:hypothetical protein